MPKLIPFSDLAQVNPPATRSFPAPDCEVSFIPMQDVTDSGDWAHRQTKKISSIGNGYTAFQEGDVLFAKITPCMENGKGTHAIGLVNGVGFGSTEFHVLRAKGEYSSRFIFHWCNSSELRQAAEVLMTGSAGQKRVPVEFFSKFLVTRIGENEQHAIADILDNVNDAIRRTEAVIAKLRLMKAGMLHDLLTRGIDENGGLRDPLRHPEQFKDSPLGRIPKEWEIAKLDDLAEIIMGQSPPGSFYNQEGKGMPLINGPVEFGERYPKVLQWTTVITKLCYQEDLLLCVRGSTTGKMNVSNGIFCIGRGVAAIRGKKQIAETSFLELFFISIAEKILEEARGSGSTFPNINSKRLLSTLISKPSIYEQIEIVKRIESIALAIDKEMIELIKLRRTQASPYAGPPHRSGPGAGKTAGGYAMSLDLDSLREGWDFEAKLAIGQDGRGQLPKNLWETYSAMANTHGGIVVLGVEEKRDGSLLVHGLAAVDKIERDLWNCLGNTEKVSFNLLGREAVERHDIEGKTVLVLRIPRADRRQRPVFINNNPLRGTFVRTHEGDRRASEDTVRRMLSDADERPRDGEIQEHFSLDDLDPDSLAAYRHLFRSNYPGHPFLAGDDRDMLRQLGGWSLDRAAGTEGLTLAGLLMFGRQRSILDRLPYYQLDYRHLPSTTTPELPRWLDRVTLDGTWSGNLFDFFRKVIPKLRDGLRVPFLMGPDLFRRDESPQHEALREAMVNALIHADYMARGGIRIFRLPHGFEFNNPGLLRLPAQQIRAGGKSDCRNPSLQQMFQMIGAGEKAGSGFPKILQAWREQHWRAPALEENAESEEICLRLPTISLFPPEVTEEMERRFPKRLHRLDENGRLAVATAILEKRVTNERLQELTDKHPRDITFLLKRLVEKGFLVVNEKRRWSSYSIAPDSTAGGLNNSQHKEPSSQHKDASSQHKD